MKILGVGMVACGGYWLGASGGIFSPSLDPLWLAGLVFLVAGTVLVGMSA